MAAEDERTYRSQTPEELARLLEGLDEELKSIALVKDGEVGPSYLDWIKDPQSLTKAQRLAFANCRVCTAGHDVNVFVTRLVVQGYPHRSIYRALTAINHARALIGEQEISYDSIHAHANNHLNFKAAAVRELIEAHSEKVRKDFNQGLQSILTPAVYATVIMHKAMEDIENKPVTVAEGLVAAKFLQTVLDGNKTQTNVASILLEFNTLLEAVKSEVPPEFWDRIVAKVEEKKGQPKEIESQASGVQDFDPVEKDQDDF